MTPHEMLDKLKDTGTGASKIQIGLDYLEAHPDADCYEVANHMASFDAGQPTTKIGKVTLDKLQKILDDAFHSGDKPQMRVAAPVAAPPTMRTAPPPPITPEELKAKEAEAKKAEAAKKAAEEEEKADAAKKAKAHK